MASCKIVFLFICSVLMFATIQADDIYRYRNCSSNTTTAGSTFESNVKRLLSTLASNSLSSKTGFYNTTVRGKIPSDSVFGMFMCRGDVPPGLCQQCVDFATERLSTKCSLSKEAVMWIDECTVRFSNRLFFSMVDTRPRLHVYNYGNLSDQESFTRLVIDNLNKTAYEAAGSNSEKKYATWQTDISESRTLYFLAQCTPDLSSHDCRRCFGEAIGELPLCCHGKKAGMVLYPSCNVGYNLYPYYRSPMLTSARVPASKFSDENSSYLHHNCTTNATADSTYKMHLKTLLFYLFSNATNGNKFYKGVENTVYGLFMCRGDLHSRFCEQCILNATQRISSECGSFQEAIIWYSDCMLRYSYRDFFFQVEETPNFQMLNVTTISNPVPGEASFTFILSNTLLDLEDVASYSEERYATKSSKFNDSQTLYTLAQCTQDLSREDCGNCLEDIHENIPWSHLGSIGGRVLYPSCNLRFEFFQFYGDVYEAQSPRPLNLSPLGQKEKRKSQLRATILIIVLPIVSVVLFSIGYYLIRRKVRKSAMKALIENFGHESATLEPLQFNLDAIEVATNNFSNDNKIGKGGFGEVYKGILSDGRQIAVKRLSKGSNQGANEFKNEVLLIAKLQHRNLVAFIGFCLEEQEKILIYEYVPNKSLDYFLFDPQRSKLLSWHERYDIIGGIAKGILYLHEHSRLKVIHRDLKPSNVLLDENMIPKISDFGLARIVDINQDQGSTKRIVGTFGYMSPEYAMCGQFSEKSDVFSFGVMVLEIISGKKNLSYCEPHSAVDGLLSYVWRQWKGETPLSILDPSIKEHCSELDVVRCIQIGLLCIQQNPDDRPTMVQVASYLSSHLIALPSPQKPALFIHSRMYPKSFGQESSSSHSNNESTPLFSNNEISITEILPR